jgi:SAM-dependent methyltransferase
MAAESCTCCDAAEYGETVDWPSDVSQLLYERLSGTAFGGRTVLEIGCGFGRMVVGAALSGASQATGIELDAEALDEARDRADEAGVADRCRFVAGDGAELDLEAHDTVILDRAICCYADGPRLVDRSLALAREVYAITVPESRGLRGAWNRVVYTALGAWDRVFANDDRVYLHDVARIEAAILAAGFRLRSTARLDKWHLGVYARETRS